MTVSNPVTPTVSITVSPGTSVCTGSKVTFNATTINGGTSPVYQWKKNGVNVGTNSNTYVIDTALRNGDSVYCVLTSNATCLTTSMVSSNRIKMTVTTPVAPSVSIIASPGTNVCAGSKVTFTATTTNGGSSPLYQWKKNGINVGTNSNTYIETGLKNGDSIYCVLTSNASCVTTPTAKSNVLKMKVSKAVTPSVIIAALPTNSICSGSLVTFTAIPTDGGAVPAYQWRKNGINVGTNYSTYIDSAIKNGDSIYCVLTSNAGCVTAPTINSNGIKMIVNKCATPFSEQSVTTQKTVKEEPGSLSLRSAPNPFKNSVQLTITSPASTKAVIFITDITGRKVFKQDISLNPGTNTVSVPSSTWSSGSYFTQISSKSETQSCKIIKE